MSDTETPPRLLAIVVKAPSEVEANVLASRLAYLAIFQPAFKNKYEGGWVAKDTPHETPQPNAPDLEDLEIERQHQHSQGWVASIAVTGGWLATEPNRDARATVAAAWALQETEEEREDHGEL